MDRSASYLTAFALLLVSSFSVSSCRIVVGEQKQDLLLAKVGKYQIKMSDIAYRDEIIKLQNPEEKRSLGMDQLLRAYTHAEILDQNGHLITEEIIKQEEARIDSSTLMPEALNRIKAVFHGDMDAYRRIFVLPVYAERTLPYEFFLNDPVAQKDSYSKAKEFLKRALASKKHLSQLAKQDNFTVNHFTVSASQGVRWDGSSEKNSKPDLSEARRWIEEVLQPLRPGELCPKVINYNSHWMVAKYKERATHDSFRVEAVMIPKANFEKWYKAEKKKIKIKRYD